MKCPDCCAGITSMDKKDKSFYDFSYFENAAKYFYGMRRINLTGGEPSMHPEFGQYVPHLKELFGCQILSIWTNGTMIMKKAETFKHFDQIHITNYTADTFEGSPDNSEQIEWIKEYLKGLPIEIFSDKIIHLPQQTGKSKMCFRGYSDTVEFTDGYIYPCCTGSGLKTKARIPLSHNWKQEILNIHPPCNECVFAE